MELRSGRVVKRTRADFESLVADRAAASGSHAEASQLCRIHSGNGAAVSTTHTSLASGTHPWNALVPDLQERILRHLPLQELGRAVCLGKAFRSAFWQRALQVEQGLVSAGVAAFGRPLLEGVGQVLQRYRQRTDLATGCGAMRLKQGVWIDRCGTVTNGGLYDAVPLTCKDGQEPYARVFLDRHEGVVDVVQAPNLTLIVTGPNRDHWAGFRLSGPTCSSSVRLRNEAAHLIAKPHCHLLGAMFIIAQQAGEEPTCQNSAEQPQHKLGAHPAAPPFPGGGNSAQHPQEDAGNASSGTPFQASQAILHPPPRRVAAGAVRRLYAFPGTRQRASGDLMEQGMITTLKLAQGFQAPCCEIALGSIARVFTCESEQYCRQHRVRA